MPIDTFGVQCSVQQCIIFAHIRKQFWTPSFPHACRYETRCNVDASTNDYCAFPSEKRNLLINLQLTEIVGDTP